MQNATLVALSGQVALRRKLDVIANNVANMDTAGFKRVSLDFEQTTMPKASATLFPRRDRDNRGDRGEDLRRSVGTDRQGQAGGRAGGGAPQRGPAHPRRHGGRRRRRDGRRGGRGAGPLAGRAGGRPRPGVDGPPHRLGGGLGRRLVGRRHRAERDGADPQGDGQSADPPHVHRCTHTRPLRGVDHKCSAA